MEKVGFKLVKALRLKFFIRHLGCFGLLGFFSLLSGSAVACDARAGDNYEAVYCAIVAKSDSHGLPTLDDFRRNDEIIQKLLLKRVAIGLAIPMPAAKRGGNYSISNQNSKKETSQTEIAARRPSVAQSSNNQAAVKKSSIRQTGIREPKKNPQIRSYPLDPKKPLRPSPKKESKTARREQPSQKLAMVMPKVRQAQNDSKDMKKVVSSTLDSRCVLNGKKITCHGDIVYKLIEDKNSQVLSAEVFAAENKLSLPKYQGDPEDKPSVKRHLQKAFRLYLNKMIAVGLGGSTITFNKFEYIYYDAQRRNFDFVNRFEMMFDFLKSEKKNSGGSVAVKLDKGLGIQHCGQLDGDTIICSITAKNHVFMRRG